LSEALPLISDPCALAPQGKNVVSVQIISASTTLDLGQQPAAPKATAAAALARRNPTATAYLTAA